MPLVTRLIWLVYVITYLEMTVSRCTNDIEAISGGDGIDDVTLTDASGNTVWPV